MTCWFPQKVSRGKRAQKWQIAEKGRNYTQNPYRCRDYCRFYKSGLRNVSQQWFTLE
ncbi:hypothetical protein D088_730030 [Salmonella enterica subsp. houtenae serovar 16:z4,z32:-- str. RKS3027]|nr:hypothetical protein D088_730030 [Salmonella enterica subsp. houtenae serovar 16:z4,z32:-- str. RKS3027]